MRSYSQMRKYTWQVTINLENLHYNILLSHGMRLLIKEQILPQPPMQQEFKLCRNLDAEKAHLINQQTEKNMLIKHHTERN